VSSLGDSCALIVIVPLSGVQPAFLHSRIIETVLEE
tara:strand:+ start:215 stop:322 length:108 start_codon:yes stop_codon:yes gene_type:complete